MNIFKSIILLIITIFISTTVSAQYTWDEQASNCDELNKRSIKVQVKDVYSDGLYKITVYKGSTFIHESHQYYVAKNEEKNLTLAGIPSGEFTVFLERNERIVSSKRITFNPCLEVFEDAIIWADEAIDCSDNGRRLVSVNVTNESNESHAYRITVYSGDTRFHGGLPYTIQPQGNKTITLGGMPFGYYQVRLERDGVVQSSKHYRFRACGTEQPAVVEWTANTGNCDQNNKRDIEVTVHNNSKQQKSFAVKIYRQDNSFVHGGRDVSIASKSKKTLSLAGIPAGFFRVQIVSNNEVIGSTNYVFENCNISSSEINTLTQAKNFEPFFTKLETAFSINLSDYFKSTECSDILYTFKKLSPGINYQRSGTVLSIVPTPSFLGKTQLEITAQCGNSSLVENITIHTQAPISILQKYNVQIVNIGGLIFDPVMPQYDNKRIHEVYDRWNDPMGLSEAYIDEMTKASGKYIYYNLADWSYFNEFPVQTDGTQFNPETYDAHYKKDGDRNVTTRIDYPKIVQQYGTVDKVNQKQIDEVWFFGGAFFGEWEASMAGPGAFFINGGVYGEVESNRPFVIHGFNYERGLAEMIHTKGHRVENHVKRAYNNKWNIENPVTNWDKFTANFAQSNSEVYGVGSIHMPANGNDHYDYFNDQTVLSYALDFANYPNLTGAVTEISKDAWGGTQQGYMKFWFGLLPKAEGINEADGRLNNWWKYIYDYSRYNIGGQSLNTEFERQSTIGNQYLTEGAGSVFLFDLDDYFVDTDIAIPQLRTGVYQNGINLYLIGAKVYAHIPPNSAGSYLGFLKVCDEDYRHLNYFNIYVNESGNRISLTTSIESSNYPNPFNTSTTILYTLPQSSAVSIKIYNSAGVEIEILTDNTIQQKGKHQVNFDGSKHSAGIYYYSIQSDEDFSMHKMILMNK